MKPPRCAKICMPRPSQILSDARRTDAAHTYELQWLAGRITQIAHSHVLRPAARTREPNNLPYFASPDIPIWRSAKAAGKTSLLTKGEVNAYAEIEYVQTHSDGLIEDLAKNMTNLRSFAEKFPRLSDGSADLTSIHEDLQTYLGLLTAVEVAASNYRHWVRILTGAELAVRDGKTKLEEIYASESKQGGPVSMYSATSPVTN